MLADGNTSNKDVHRSYMREAEEEKVKDLDGGLRIQSQTYTGGRNYRNTEGQDVK